MIFLSWVTRVLFIVYLYGLGYSLTRFNKERSVNMFIIRLGVGLAGFVVLGLVFNLFKIPLDWRLFLCASVILPVFDLGRRKNKLEFNKISFQKPAKTILCLLGIFVFCYIIYCIGPFQYAGLEDDDPWYHAAGTKYVAVEKNLAVPKGMFQYIDPYPPGYDLLMGILHQTYPLVTWVLKYFNGLIICLGIMFFYVFAKEFSGDETKALLATYFLAVMPCFFSHFIWAHTLSIALFFVAFTLTLKVKDDQRYLLAAVIVLSAIFLVQPTQAIKFIIMYFIFCFSLFLNKECRSLKIVKIVIFAGIVAIVLWWGPVLIRSWQGETALVLRDAISLNGVKAYDLNTVSSLSQEVAHLFSPTGGTATKAYQWQYYFFTFIAGNYYNVPFGIGLVLSILALLGLSGSLWTYGKQDSRKKTYSNVLIGWFVFTFLGLNSETFHLPIGLFAFRFWLLLSVPVALFAAEAVCTIRRKTENKMFPLLMILLLVFYTSGVTKTKINFNIWKAGSFWKETGELQGYQLFSQNVPINSKVFMFTRNFLIIGFNLDCDFWTASYRRVFRDADTKNPSELKEALVSKGYRYLVIGPREKKSFGEAWVDRKIKQLSASRDFRLFFKYQDSVWVFQVHRDKPKHLSPQSAG